MTRHCFHCRHQSNCYCCDSVTMVHTLVCDDDDVDGEEVEEDVVVWCLLLFAVVCFYSDSASSREKPFARANQGAA